MPTTSNFGWTTPADTDLVKDGAAAIRTLGNGIDTSFLDLKGGTTGQVLSKNSNTDLDYTWITPNVGDITEVQAGTGISISSGTGPIPVVTNTVATAFDAAGDLVYGTGADTFTKLSLGTAGQVLTVNSGATATQWSTPAAGGKVLQVVSATSTTATTITTDTMADTGITATITPTASNSKILVLISAAINIKRTNTDIFAGAQLMRGATKIADWFPSSSSRFVGIEATGATYVALTNQNSIVYLDSPATTSSTTYKLQAQIEKTTNSASIIFQPSTAPSTITLLEIGA